MSKTVQQTERQVSGETVSGERVCIGFTGANIIYISVSLSGETENFAIGPDYFDQGCPLSAEKYPILAEIWDNDDDAIFDNM